MVLLTAQEQTAINYRELQLALDVLPSLETEVEEGIIRRPARGVDSHNSGSLPCRQQP